MSAPQTATEEIRVPAEPEQAAYGLDLLRFDLPEFSRVSWVGDAARRVWQPRLERIFAAWMEVEARAVSAGLRECSVSTVSAHELPETAGRYARRGLCTLPVAIQRATNYGYSNTAGAPAFGEPFLYRIVVGSTSSVSAMQSAWDDCDDERIGRLLGYPDCCRRFFRSVWVDHGLRDTTWPMAKGSTVRAAGDRVLEVGGPPQANILWRWMGVRSVSHLPCRFDCPATVALADELLRVGRDNGYAEEMDWILEILDWPAQWSCLHGIAEIKTPILKVSANTDATASKFVVRRAGGRYPAEGAKGLEFPYRMPHAPRLTTSRRYQSGLANPLPIVGQD
jgi:hypothetical protein